jgi:hypothetical protein
VDILPIDKKSLEWYNESERGFGRERAICLDDAREGARGVIVGAGGS